MAALAYALLPVTGLIAFLGSRSPRTRWHGLQAIALGLVWAVVLYPAARLSAGLTQALFVLGALLWIWFMVATARGRDPALPFLGGILKEIAAAMREE